MSALTEHEEEQHDTQPVAVLPVGGSANRESQTIAAGGREEDNNDRGGGRGEEGSDGQGGVGGPAHSFPPFFSFWRAPFSFFFVLARITGIANTQKQTDQTKRGTKRGPFFDKMIIPPPSLRFSD